MYRLLCFLLPCLVPFASISLSDSQYEQAAKQETSIVSNSEKTESSMIDIQIVAGDTAFPAKLHDNPTTKAFIQQLPLTITMDELNGNEKFYYLPDSLPTAAYNPSEIKAGDLMLYGSDCLVWFYEDFSTSYSYTKLGYTENAIDLADAIGDGSVAVTFKTE